MKKAIFFLLLFFLFALNTFAQTDTGATDKEVPPDFKSDGCSLFPDGKYKDCCVAHDKDYYSGGSCAMRLKSDNQLFKCVAAKKGLYPKLIAPFMWLGVRVFGVPFLPTSFRWGFGKKKPKNTKYNIKPKNKQKKKKSEKSTVSNPQKQKNE